MQRQIAAATILISALLLFVRLGHYALWDDEANTALIGEGVWRTGDTSALLDHNIVAFRRGGELEGTRARYIPPLQYYVAAPFVGPFPPSSFLARLPFALVGLGAIALMLLWMSRITLDPISWALLGFGIICSVSLFLYCRQCRYYSLAIATTVACGYLYYFWSGRTRDVILLAAALFFLLAANYVNFLAALICLAVDYAIWGRHHLKVKWQHILAVAIPVALLGAPVVLIWNPLGKSITAAEHTNWLVEHGVLFWRNLQGLIRNEFGVGILLVATPFIALFMRSGRYIWRLWVAAAVYIVAVSICSPQPVSKTDVADVRYLAPLIPVLVAIDVTVIAVIAGGRWKIALPLGLILLGTNLGNLGVYGGPNPRLDKGQIAGFSSTITRFMGELIWPVHDPYRAAADWINANVRPREMIYVSPDFAIYPLMFHAPEPIYSWQLDWPPANKELEKLPDTYFNMHGFVDYVIAFGPAKRDLIEKHGFPGEPAFALTPINVFWRELYRPELIWREFKPITKFDPNDDAIYIYAMPQKIAHAIDS